MKALKFFRFALFISMAMLAFCVSSSYAVNNALTFDGSDDYVNCGDSAFQIATGTWEAWFKVNALGSDQTIISKDDSGYNDDGWLGIASDNRIYFYIDKPAVSCYELYSDATVSTGIWYHIAVTWGSGGMKMYVNGILQTDTDANTSGIISSGSNLRIGSRNDTTFSNYYYFNGQIDDVRIWNIARNQAEIKQYMNTTLTGSESNLVAYYNFDQISGTTTLPDLAGGDNNGTLTNMTGSEWAASGAVVIPPGNTLDFNGANQYVDCGTGINPSVFTIESWVKLNTLSDGVIASKINSDLGYYYQNFELRTTASGNINFMVPDGSSWLSVTSAATIIAGIWYHIAGTYDGTTAKIYINGVQDSNTLSNSTYASTDNADTNFTIGTRSLGSSSLFFNGQIDEVRLWNIARTQTDIQNNMHNTLDPSGEGNLAAYYRFDQAGGTTLTDYTANNYHGTLTNMAGTEWTASGAMCPFPISAANVTTIGFTANWNAVNGATGFRIDVSTDSNFGSFITNGQDIDAGSGTSFNVTGLTLTPGSVYYFLMRAEKSGWTSPNSAPVTVMFSPGNALQFDGADDYVTVPDNANLNFTGNFTLEAWIYKNTSFSGWSGIIRKGNYFLVGIQGTDKVRLGFVDTSPVEYDCDSLSDIPNNQWVHIAGVYDGTNLIIYINGVLDISTNIGSHTILTGTSPLYLGESSSYYFNGKMDEVRIWNTARTQSQIQSSMMKDVTGTGGLVAYYKFDHTSGTTLTDIAGGDNNGTLTNMAGTEWTASTAFNVWTGPGAGNWNTASNWSRNSVPTSSDNVYVTSNSVNLTGTTGSCNHLVNEVNIQMGVALQVSGNIYNNGTFTTAPGSLVCSGTDPQYIRSAGSIGIMEINNTGGGIVLAGNLTVGSSLTMTDGGLNLNGYTFSYTPGAFLPITAFIPQAVNFLQPVWEVLLSTIQ